MGAIITESMDLERQISTVDITGKIQLDLGHRDFSFTIVARKPETLRFQMTSNDIIQRVGRRQVSLSGRSNLERI
jgi:hypothetical protein